MKEHYYYLHDNRELIHKNYYDRIEADFRDSDSVVAFWSIDSQDRQNAWDMLVEAGSLGAKQGRIKELAGKWGCNDEDGKIYCKRIDVAVEMDGNAWRCYREDFTNLQESPCGFGETILDALIDFCKNLDFKITKLNWHARFNELVKV